MENPLKCNIATRDREWFIISNIPEDIKDSSFKSLDIGSGLGYFTQVLTDNAVNKKNVISIDIDLKCLEYQKKVISKNVVLGDCQFLPFKRDSFNLIIASEVIEHLKNDDFFIKDVSMILKKGGKLIITTPSLEGVFKPTKSCHDQEGPEYHYKTGYKKKELINLLSSNGFTNLKFGYSLTFFSKIIIEITKFIFSLKRNFKAQSDILNIDKKTSFKVLKLFFPSFMFLLKIDYQLSRFLKGSCIMVSCEKS